MDRRFALKLRLVVMSLLLILTGCKNANIPAGDEEQIITIDFWDLAVDGDTLVNQTALNAIKQIEEENPRIKINYSTEDGDDYKIKIKTAVADGNPPDIFYTWLPGYAQEFVDRGVALKLDDYLSEDTYKNINKEVLYSANATYDGIYALSSEVKMGILYCNTKLFEENDVQIPSDFEELLTVIDQFNEKGIQPIQVPGKRYWPIMWLYDILALKSMGSQQVIDALSQKSSFDQEGFLEAARKVQILVDRSAFTEDFLVTDNVVANERFLNGEIPMYYIGSWFSINTIDIEQPVYGNVTAIRFPGFGNEFDNHMLGGTGDGFMIAKDTDHKEEAVWVVERFTSLMAESDAVLIPAWQVEKNYQDMEPVLRDIVRLYQEADGFVIWWDTYMDSVDAETHKRLTYQLFAKAITPEEFIEDMEKIKD